MAQEPIGESTLAMAWCHHSNNTFRTMHCMFLMPIAIWYALYDCEMEYASMTIMCIAFRLPFGVCSAISFWLPPCWVTIEISDKWGWILNFQTKLSLRTFLNKRAFYDLKPHYIYDNKEATSQIMLYLVCFCLVQRGTRKLFVCETEEKSQRFTMA